MGALLSFGTSDVDDCSDVTVGADVGSVVESSLLDAPGEPDVAAGSLVSVTSVVCAGPVVVSEVGLSVSDDVGVSAVVEVLVDVVELVDDELVDVLDELVEEVPEVLVELVDEVVDDGPVVLVDVDVVPVASESLTDASTWESASSQALVSFSQPNGNSATAQNPTKNGPENKPGLRRGLACRGSLN